MAGYVALLVRVLLLLPGAALGLVAPAWALAVFLAVWIVLLVLGVRLLRAGSWLVVLAPLATIAFVLVALTLGDAVLGWTA